MEETMNEERLVGASFMEEMTFKHSLEKKREMSKVVKEQEGIPGRDLSIFLKSSCQRNEIKENCNMKMYVLSMLNKTHAYAYI